MFRQNSITTEMSGEKKATIIIRDLLYVFGAVYFIYSWIEWRNPSSVSTHFNLEVLIYFIAILLFLFFTLRDKFVSLFFFYIPALLLIVEYISRITYYGYSAKEQIISTLLPNYTINALFLLIVMFFVASFFLKTGDNEQNDKGKPLFLTRKKLIYSLVLISIAGFLIRIWNIDELSPVRDEFSHLIAAKRLTQEGFFNYQRTGILTHLVFWSWKIFNNGAPSVSLARFVSVILGTISIPLIFLFCRSFSSRSVSILAAFLLATSPFHVGMSRYTREYVLFFAILLFGLYLANKLFNAIHLGKKIQIFLFVLGISPIFLYYFNVRNSTYPLIFIVMLLYFFSYFFVFLYEKRHVISKWFRSYDRRSRKKLIYIFSIFTAFPIIWIFKRFFLGNVFFKAHDFTNNWLEIFFSISSSQQWFYKGISPTYFIITLFVLGIFYGYKKRQVLASLTVMLLMFLVYSFLLDISAAPRYILPLLVFEILIFAYSIAFIFNILNPKTTLNKIIISVFLLCIFNPFLTISFINSEKDGEESKQQRLIHRDTNELITFIEKNGFNQKDALVTANKGIFAFYYNYPFVYSEDEWPYDDLRLNSKKQLARDYSKIAGINHLNNAVKNFSKGWIVIDKDRNRHWSSTFELGDFTIEDTVIHYLGKTEGSRGFDVYSWDK